MKNSLSDIYDQILLNEAEKHALQNPSQDEVGNIKAKQDLFGTKPKVVEGPDKGKVKQGPAYETTTGSASKPAATKSSMPNSAPAKDEEAEEAEEMEDTDVDPTNEEEEEEKTEKKTEKKKEVKEESFTMSAFETLFKKTINEEVEDEMETSAPEMEAGAEELELEDTEENEESEESEESEEEEGDLIADLKDLQDKLSSILSKLEDSMEDESEDESEEEYTEDEFDAEFGEEGEEEDTFKESMDKPKALNSSKGKMLTSKKNKVGKINPKGGKANGGKLKSEPTPKALGDKKAKFQKGKPEVKSTVKKGDFIK
jgi:hypothetical protein